MMTPESAYYAATLESIHVKLDKLDAKLDSQRVALQQLLLAQGAALISIALLQRSRDVEAHLHTMAERTKVVAESLGDK